VGTLKIFDKKNTSPAVSKSPAVRTLKIFNKKNTSAEQSKSTQRSMTYMQGIYIYVCMSCWDFELFWTLKIFDKKKAKSTKARDGKRTQVLFIPSELSTLPPCHTTQQHSGD
jgi:hypothetical protein